MGLFTVEALPYRGGMPMLRRAIILSDIHLGPQDHSIFRDGPALCRLLEQFERDIILVLAGDIFDFLQIPGYSGFDAALAAERFDRYLLKADRNVQVIAALARFASRSGNEVILLSGNHDPETLLLEVREQFEKAIGRVGSVRYPDDETPLWPAVDEHQPVHGVALAENSVWVVHGDRWDPANWIDRKELRRAVMEGRPVSLPPGSHLVFEVLQQIGIRHPWVHTLKPEVGAVLPILLYLDYRTTSMYLRRHYRLTGALLRSIVTAKLRHGELFGYHGEKPAIDPVINDLAQALADAAQESESQAERDVLLAELESVLDSSSATDLSPTDDTLAPHTGLRRWCARAWLNQVRQSDRFLHLNGPDPTPDAAAPYLHDGLVALVSGHTHGPRAITAHRPAYFNSGTWIPVSSVPDGDLKARIDQLDQEQAWPAEVPRTLIEVTWGEQSPRVALWRCDHDGVLHQEVALD